MNTINANTGNNCLADTSRLLPSNIGVGESATGLVLLDVTTPTGEVAFDFGGLVEGGGWVWKYPSA